MSSHHTLATAGKKVAPEPLFTVERANRALVLVRKIVADIVAQYAELVRLRAEMTELETAGRNGERYAELREQIEGIVEALNRVHRELADTGCVLKDWRTGLVDFPAEREGRRVWLCWRLDEPCVAHWHELDAGVAGRQPLAEE